MLNQKNYENCLMKVRTASLDDYKPYYGKKGNQDEMVALNKDDLVEEESASDPTIQYYKQQIQMKNTKVLREMLSGIVFALRIEQVRAQIYTPGLQIRKQQEELPNLEVSVGPIVVSAGV